MTVLTHLGIVCPGRLGNSMCTSLVSKFGSLHLPSSLFFSEHFASIVSREAFTSLLSFRSFAAAIMLRLYTDDLSSQWGGEDPVDWDVWLIPEALQDTENLEAPSCSSNNLEGKDHATGRNISWELGSQPESSLSVPFSVLAQCESWIPYVYYSFIVTISNFTLRIC